MKVSAPQNKESRAYVRGLNGVAAYMDMPVDTVKKQYRVWCVNGQIEWPARIGKGLYFRKASLDRFYEVNKVVRSRGV